MHPENRGRLFIVSAPSGAGKTTLISRVLKQFDTLSYSVSHTTRPPRGTEQDGKDYFFVTAQEFEEKIKNNELLEWAKVHNNYYGTSRRFVEQTLEQGRSLLLDIDVQGACQIMESGLDPVSIFIMPPSVRELEQRLRHRGTDTDEVIATRLQNAETEIGLKDRYSYVVLNDDLDEAVIELSRIFKKEMV